MDEIDVDLIIAVGIIIILLFLLTGILIWITENQFWKGWF